MTYTLSRMYDDPGVDYRVVRRCRECIRDRIVDEKNQLRLWLDIPEVLHRIILEYSIISDRILLDDSKYLHNPGHFGGLRVENVEFEYHHVLNISFTTDRFALRKNRRNRSAFEDEADIIKVLRLSLEVSICDVFEACATLNTQTLVSKWMDNWRIEHFIEQHKTLPSQLYAIANDVLQYMIWFQ